jgi:hypothetical protein
MFPPRKPLPLRAVVLSTALALAGLAALITDAHAAFRGGSFRTMAIGSRPILSHGPRIPGNFKVLNTKSASIGRPPHRRPPHGKHPKYPPGIGPVGPIGPLVGTGVVAGTLGSTGPAGAGPQPILSGAGRGGIYIPPSSERRLVPDEVLLEFAGNPTPQSMAQLLARHGLVQLETQRFALTGSVFVRARITGNRSVRATLARLGSETMLRSGQPNFLYATSQAASPHAITATDPTGPLPAAAASAALPGAGDPAQYALRKLRLNEAHAHATGDKVLIAVIDSGIDLGHPELQGVVAGAYDALGKTEKPHPHGTGVAGVIASHARLLGAAPSARILAIRAFGAAGVSAEATTYAVMKGVEFATARQARVINMSFAGPADPDLSRQLGIARTQGIILIAASGNFGPKSGPQYPAADPNVIAVSATDAHDSMFKAANIGPHIAMAAPGVDILLPAPDRNYQLISGTSFAAAYVSGIVALLLQRAPELTPDAVRRVLESTARDLGPRGKDKEYGAGLVDAYGAILAVQADAVARP